MFLKNILSLFAVSVFLFSCHKKIEVRDLEASLGNSEDVQIHIDITQESYLFLAEKDISLYAKIYNADSPKDWAVVGVDMSYDANGNPTLRPYFDEMPSRLRSTLGEQSCITFVDTGYSAWRVSSNELCFATPNNWKISETVIGSKPILD